MRSARCEGMVATAVTVLLVLVVAGAQAQTKESGHQKTGVVDRGVAGVTREAQPTVGISVTLSVYSGRPNPNWTVEPGPELDRLVALLKDLKPTDAKLFDYDEWNRLGYASFRVSTRGLPGVPSEIHIWRDMAVVPAAEGKGMQATGASKLYAALVTQAEARGYPEFFLNYHKLPPGTKRSR